MALGVYVLLALLWAAVIWVGNPWLAVGLQIASRLAYVGGVGALLWREDRDQVLRQRLGGEQAFRHFRSIASVIMNNDVVAFLVMVWVTRGTLDVALPVWTLWLVGGALMVFGLQVKFSALRCLGAGGYYWKDFFVPPPSEQPVLKGPYRWLSNPMYTVGYIHAYGFALVLESAHGLVLAGFIHVAILAFYALVEHPHCKTLYGARGIARTRAQLRSAEEAA
jgi:protein-S-isoprenylcysteine O-methyltransferase Ste14